MIACFWSYTLLLHCTRTTDCARWHQSRQGQTCIKYSIRYIYIGHQVSLAHMLDTTYKFGAVLTNACLLFVCAYVVCASMLLYVIKFVCVCRYDRTYSIIV